MPLVFKGAVDKPSHETNRNFGKMWLDRLDDNDVGLRISGPWPTSSLHWSYLATSLISGHPAKYIEIGMFFWFKYVSETEVFSKYTYCFGFLDPRDNGQPIFGRLCCMNLRLTLP